MSYEIEGIQDQLIHARKALHVKGWLAAWAPGEQVQLSPMLWCPQLMVIFSLLVTEIGRKF